MVRTRKLGDGRLGCWVACVCCSLFLVAGVERSEAQTGVADPAVADSQWLSVSLGELEDGPPFFLWLPQCADSVTQSGCEAVLVLPVDESGATRRVHLTGAATGILAELQKRGFGISALQVAAKRNADFADLLEKSSPYLPDDHVPSDLETFSIDAEGTDGGRDAKLLQTSPILTPRPGGGKLDPDSIDEPDHEGPPERMVCCAYVQPGEGDGTECQWMTESECGGAESGDWGCCLECETDDDCAEIAGQEGTVWAGNLNCQNWQCIRNECVISENTSVYCCVHPEDPCCINPDDPCCGSDDPCCSDPSSACCQHPCGDGCTDYQTKCDAGCQGYDAANPCCDAPCSSECADMPDHQAARCGTICQGVSDTCCEDECCAFHDPYYCFCHEGVEDPFCCQNPSHPFCRDDDWCTCCVGPDDPDCDGNGVHDSCQSDCDANNVPDVCELSGNDCNTNNIPDNCEMDLGTDCNGNNILDVCESGFADCNANGKPDECERDCDGDGTIDACEIAAGTAPDSDNDGIPDNCEYSPLNLWAQGWGWSSVSESVSCVEIPSFLGKAFAAGRAIGNSSTSNLFVHGFRLSNGSEWSVSWTHRFVSALGLGGNAGDIVDIHYGADGLLVTGYWEGVMNFDPAQGDQRASEGGTDVFVTLLSQGGTPLWTRTFGGPGLDKPLRVYRDANQDVVIAGLYDGDVDFDPTEVSDIQSSRHKQDVAVTRLRNDGSYVGTQILRLGEEQGGISIKAVVGDDSGDLFVIGSNSTVDFIYGPGVDIQIAGKFISRISATNTTTRTWRSPGGSMGVERVELDGQGHVVVGGTIDGYDGESVFVAKLDAQSLNGWEETLFMDSQDVVVKGMTVHPWFGDIWLTGIKGGSKAFLARYSSDPSDGNGAPNWSEWSSVTHGHAVAVGGPTGSSTYMVLVGGAFSGRIDFDHGPRQVILQSNNGLDAFIAGFYITELFSDCNSNGQPDWLDVEDGLSQDCNGNSLPDECEEDCNSNGIADECELLGNDCDGNMVLDTCEWQDCDNNGQYDVCQAGYGDCNEDGVADFCDLALASFGGGETVTPSSAEVSCEQGEVTFTVAATTGDGSTPIYQWYHHGQPIPGATGPVLTLPVVVPDTRAGEYYCQITHPTQSCLTRTSSRAELTVDTGGNSVTIQIDRTGRSGSSVTAPRPEIKPGGGKLDPDPENENGVRSLTAIVNGPDIPAVPDGYYRWWKLSGGSYEIIREGVGVAFSKYTFTDPANAANEGQYYVEVSDLCDCTLISAPIVVSMFDAIGDFEEPRPWVDKGPCCCLWALVGPNSSHFKCGACDGVGWCLASQWPDDGEEHEGDAACVYRYDLLNLPPSEWENCTCDGVNANVCSEYYGCTRDSDCELVTGAEFACGRPICATGEDGSRFCTNEPECQVDGDCFDGDPCTTDTCTIGGCCDYQPKCDTYCEDCIEGTCVEKIVEDPCASHADCDDNNACNGQEVCLSCGACGPGEPVVCPDCEECNDTSGVCEPLCVDEPCFDECCKDDSCEQQPTLIPPSEVTFDDSEADTEGYVEVVVGKWESLPFEVCNNEDCPGTYRWEASVTPEESFQVSPAEGTLTLAPHTCATIADLSVLADPCTSGAAAGTVVVDVRGVSNGECFGYVETGPVTDTIDVVTTLPPTREIIVQAPSVSPDGAIHSSAPHGTVYNVALGTNDLEPGFYEFQVVGQWDRNVVRAYLGFDAAGAQIGNQGSGWSAPPDEILPGRTLALEDENFLLRLSFLGIRLPDAEEREFTVRLNKVGASPAEFVEYTIRVVPSLGAAAGDGLAYLPSAILFGESAGSASVNLASAKPVSDLVMGPYVEFTSVPVSGKDPYVSLLLHTPGSVYPVQIPHKEMFNVDKWSSTFDSTRGGEVYGKPGRGVVGSSSGGAYFTCNFSGNVPQNPKIVMTDGSVLQFSESDCDPTGNLERWYLTSVTTVDQQHITYTREEPTQGLKTLRVRHEETAYENYVISRPNETIVSVHEAGAPVRSWRLTPGVKGYLNEVAPENGPGRRTYVRDAFGRVTRVLDASGDPRADFDYYAENSIGAKKVYFEDGAAPVVTSQYTYGSGTATMSVYPGDGPPRTVMFAYGADGNLASVTDPLGSQTTYTYDQTWGRLLETNYADGSKIIHKYFADIYGDTPFTKRTKHVAVGGDPDGELGVDYEILEDRVLSMSESRQRYPVALQEVISYKPSGEPLYEFTSIHGYSRTVGGEQVWVLRPDSVWRSPTIGFDDDGNTVTVQGPRTNYTYDSTTLQLTQVTVPCNNDPDCKTQIERMEYDNAGRLVKSISVDPSTGEEITVAYKNPSIHGWGRVEGPYYVENENCYIAEVTRDQWGRVLREDSKPGPACLDKGGFATTLYHYEDAYEAVTNSEGRLLAVDVPHYLQEPGSDGQPQPKRDLTTNRSIVARTVPSYDDAGRVVQVASGPAGTGAVNTFAEQPLVNQVVQNYLDETVFTIDEQLNITHVSYNLRGQPRLIQEGHASRAETMDTHMVYDSVTGRLAQVIPPSGSPRSYFYDGLSRLVRASEDNDGIEAIYGYDENGIKTDAEIRIPTFLGTMEIIAKKQWKYDGYGRLIRETAIPQDQSGSQAQPSHMYVHYYDNGSMSRVFQPGNAAAGRPDAAWMDFAYDGFGRLKEARTPWKSSLHAPLATRITRVDAYDAAGHMLSETTLSGEGDDGATTSYDYDSLGQLVTFIGKHNLVTTSFKYSDGLAYQSVEIFADGLRQLCTERDWAGRLVMNWQPKESGRPGYVKPQSGDWLVRVNRDPVNGRVVEIRNHQNEILQQIGYDDANSRISTKYPGEVGIEGQLNPLTGELLSTKVSDLRSGKSATTSFTHDNLGQVKEASIQAPELDALVGMDRDALGRLQQLVNRRALDKVLARFSYGPWGFIQSVVRPLSDTNPTLARISNLAIDVWGGVSRIFTTTPGAPSTPQMETLVQYGPDGMPLKFNWTDPESGQVVPDSWFGLYAEYALDESIIKEELVHPRTINGLRSIVMPETITKTYQYYDEAGRFHVVETTTVDTVDPIVAQETAGERQREFVYNGLGNVVEGITRIRLDGESEFSDLTKVLLVYDEFQRVIQEHQSLYIPEWIYSRPAYSGAYNDTTWVFRYEYDQDGNLAKMIMPDGKEMRHTYDASGRLTRQEYFNAENVRLNDAVMNHDVVGQLTSVNINDHLVDLEINRIAMPVPGAAYGWGLQWKSWRKMGGGEIVPYEPAPYLGAYYDMSRMLVGQQIIQNGSGPNSGDPVLDNDHLNVTHHWNRGVNDVEDEVVTSDGNTGITQHITSIVRDNPFGRVERIHQETPRGEIEERFNVYGVDGELASHTLNTRKCLGETCDTFEERSLTYYSSVGPSGMDALAGKYQWVFIDDQITDIYKQLAQSPPNQPTWIASIWYDAFGRKVWERVGDPGEYTNENEDLSEQLQSLNTSVRSRLTPSWDEFVRYGYAWESHLPVVRASNRTLIEDLFVGNLLLAHLVYWPGGDDTQNAFLSPASGGFQSDTPTRYYLVQDHRGTVHATLKELEDAQGQRYTKKIETYEYVPDGSGRSITHFNNADLLAQRPEFGYHQFRWLGGEQMPFLEGLFLFGGYYDMAQSRILQKHWRELVTQYNPHYYAYQQDVANDGFVAGVAVGFVTGLLVDAVKGVYDLGKAGAQYQYNRYSADPSRIYNPFKDAKVIWQDARNALAEAVNSQMDPLYEVYNKSNEGRGQFGSTIDFADQLIGGIGGVDILTGTDRTGNRVSRYEYGKAIGRPIGWVATPVIMRATSLAFKTYRFVGAPSLLALAKTRSLQVQRMFLGDQALTAVFLRSKNGFLTARAGFLTSGQRLRALAFQVEGGFEGWLAEQSFLFEATGSGSAQSVAAGSSLAKSPSSVLGKIGRRSGFNMPLKVINKMCFPAGTPVHAQDAHGNAILKNIEDIQVGDMVLSRDEHTGEMSYKPVLQTFVTHPDELIKLTFERVDEDDAGDEAEVAAEENDVEDAEADLDQVTDQEHEEALEEQPVLEE